MFSCKCGKHYKFKSGLSRHQHGNVKEGISPCKQFVKSTAEDAVDQALVTRLLRSIESMQEKPELVSYSLCDIVPTSLHLVFDPTNSDDIAAVPSQWLRLMHLNKEQPWYRNIIPSNQKLLTVKVFENGKWFTKPFREWVDMFIHRVIRVIFILLKPGEESRINLVRVLNERKYEAIAHIKEEFVRYLQSIHAPSPKGSLFWEGDKDLVEGHKKK